MDGNIKVVFPGSCQFSRGDYVAVKVNICLYVTSAHFHFVFGVETKRKVSGYNLDSMKP